MTLTNLTHKDLVYFATAPFEIGSIVIGISGKLGFHYNGEWTHHDKLYCFDPQLMAIHEEYSGVKVASFLWSGITNPSEVTEHPAFKEIALVKNIGCLSNQFSMASILRRVLLSKLPFEKASVVYSAILDRIRFIPEGDAFCVNEAGQPCVLHLGVFHPLRIGAEADHPNGFCFDGYNKRGNQVDSDFDPPNKTGCRVLAEVFYDEGFFVRVKDRTETLFEKRYLTYSIAYQKALAAVKFQDCVVDKVFPQQLFL